MKRMIYVSLIINVVVLIPVCFGLIFDAAWVSHGYGPTSPARAILVSIYSSILLISFGLLFKPIPLLVAPLLLVQVIYKLISPFAVGGITNPVVISNILVALVHSFTLYLIYKAVQSDDSMRSMLGWK